MTAWTGLAIMEAVCSKGNIGVSSQYGEFLEEIRQPQPVFSVKMAPK